VTSPTTTTPNEESSTAATTAEPFKITWFHVYVFIMLGLSIYANQDNGLLNLIVGPFVTYLIFILPVQLIRKAMRRRK
jgi:amino acid permease